MVSIEQLVINRLSPVFSLDTTLHSVIPDEITAQIALQGYSLLDVDDRKAVYIALLTTKALIPRLLLKFSMRLESVKGGPAETQWVDAIKFLEALREELVGQLRFAAREVEPEDVDLGMPPEKWTSTGIRSW